jgi:putative flippase GtrA
MFDVLNSYVMLQVLKGKANNTLVQLFRYVWVGGFAFVIDYGSLYILKEYIGINYLLSAAVAFIFGLAVNYLLSTFWVFPDSRLNNKMAEFAVFASIGLVGLLLNEIIMFLCCEVLNIHYLISKLCSTGIVFFWNFFARKIILFTKTKSIIGI